MPFFLRYYRLGNRKAPLILKPRLNIGRSWFVIILANITAALLVFSENSIDQLTPPCSGSPTRGKPDGAVVVLALYIRLLSQPYSQFLQRPSLALV